MRAALVVLVLAGLVAGTQALAQGGDGSPAPVVRANDVLHLPRDRVCGWHGSTVRITPPEGVELGWVSVRINRRERVRLTGVAHGASVTLHLPRDRTRLSAVAETLDGRRLRVWQIYSSCTDPHRTAKPPPIVGGEGEA